MMYAKKILVDCVFSDEYEGEFEKSITLPVMADFEAIIFNNISDLVPAEVLLKKEMYKRIESIVQNMAFLQGFSGEAKVNKISDFCETLSIDTLENDNFSNV